jgi:hypothetical protein
MMMYYVNMINMGHGQPASLAPLAWTEAPERLISPEESCHPQPVLIGTAQRLEFAASPRKQSLAVKSNRDNSTPFSQGLAR